MTKNVSPWIDETPDAQRFPVLAGTVRADVCVIGAGIVGILSAWRLARRGLRVVLLEKNRVVTGDTGATTGFLLRVPDTSLADLERRYGQAFVRDLVAAAGEAQRGVFALIGDLAIDCGLARCDAYYGAFAGGEPALRAERESVLRAFPDAEAVGAERAGGAGFTEAVRIPGEGKYDARRFLLGLLEKRPPELAVFEGSEATKVARSPSGVTVSAGEGTVMAAKVVLATGRPHESFGELAPLVRPKVTYVVAAPHAGPGLDGVYWDTSDPYFYFRKIGDGTLIVGGCDVPFEEAARHRPYERLRSFIAQRLPGTGDVTHEWSGSIFHTADGLPYAFAHPAGAGRVYAALGFGGNGMVYGALAAEVLDALAAGEAHPAASMLALERCGASIGQASAASGASGPIKAGKASDLALGGARCVTAGDRSIALFKTERGLFATDNACSHQGGSLCEGMIDGKVVQCPLHGAKFDVETGAVLGPPAVRPVRTYPVRVVGDEVEIDLTPGRQVSVAPAPSPAEPEDDAEARERTWGSLLRFATAAALFWAAEFSLQYFWLSKGELGASLVRGFALAGATLIGAALLSSAIFKWRPRLAVHWRTRRRLGVTGTILIACHVFSVLKFYFAFDIKGVFWSLDPLKNPIIFGEIAFPLFLIMAVTSTDRAVEMLGAKRWKRLHRIVYVAYWAAIFHFMTISPPLLKTPPGYLLIAVTAAALFGQLFWYVRIAGKKRFRTVGGLVGAVIILLYAVTAFLVWRHQRALSAPPTEAGFEAGMR